MQGDPRNRSPPTDSNIAKSHWRNATTAAAFLPSSCRSTISNYSLFQGNSWCWQMCCHELQSADLTRPKTRDIHAVVASLVSEANLLRLMQQINSHGYLKFVSEALRNNRPIERQLKPFSGELIEINRVVFKGCKVVIPTTMRPEILRRILHDGQLNKCKWGLRSANPEPTGRLFARHERRH